MKLFRPPSLPDHLVVLGKSGPVRVAVRRNARARRYSLRISRRDGEAVLTIPPRGTLSAATAFLDSHVGWLEARLAEQPARTPFADGALVPVRGVPHRIVATGGRGLVRLSAEGGEPRLLVPGEPAHVARRVRDHLVKLAKADLALAVARYAAALRVQPAVIRLKDTSGRWGSASTSGALAFSWRLVMAPDFVLDYVAAHEVAHLREMNHGPRFWAHVRAVCPDTEAARAWLRRNGAALLAYG